VSRPTVLGWRARYAARGLAGLGEEARSGRPRQVDYRQIVAATLRPPPRKYAVTHWSSRLLARHLKIGDATVARAWREYGVAPWRAESFRFSTDPQLEAKVVDVVGLYLHPPARAVVLCVDEKSQIQPLDRTAPILPLQPGLGRAPLARLRPARHLDPVHRAGDRYRSGHRGLQTLPPPPGVPGLPPPGRPRLSRRPAAPGDGQLRRPQTPSGPDLAGREPAGGRALHPDPRVLDDLVEVWFSIIERQAIHRGTFGSVRDLNAKIRALITGWNGRAHPSPGPRPPTRSSRRQTVRRPQTQGTSFLPGAKYVNAER